MEYGREPPQETVPRRCAQRPARSRLDKAPKRRAQLAPPTAALPNPADDPSLECAAEERGAGQWPVASGQELSRPPYHETAWPTNREVAPASGLNATMGTASGRRALMRRTPLCRWGMWTVPQARRSAVGGELTQWTVR